MKACIVGLGRAGLPLAAVVANSGLDVIGFDIDPERCAAINNGKNPIPEESGLTELLYKYGGKRIVATTDIEDARGASVYIVIVPLFLNSKNKFKKEKCLNRIIFM